MGVLLAFDATGNILATLDWLVVAPTPDGAVIVDFEAEEAQGHDLAAIYPVAGAVGHGTWPEYLGGQFHEFRVELDSAGRVSALVRKPRAAFTDSRGQVHSQVPGGHRRERLAVEAAIAAAPSIAGGRDIRHIVGGPQRPLALDDQGRTVAAKPSG